jgi:hypothetical protein
MSPKNPSSLNPALTKRLQDACSVLALTACLVAGSALAADKYGKGGQPEAEVLDVEGVETVVPFVVEECKKAPKESFWQKVKADFKKMEQKL